MARTAIPRTPRLATLDLDALGARLTEAAADRASRLAQIAVAAPQYVRWLAEYARGERSERLVDVGERAAALLHAEGLDLDDANLRSELGVLVLAVQARLALDQGAGVTTAQLAALAGVTDARVRQALGAGPIAAKRARAWLAERAAEAARDTPARRRRRRERARDPRRPPDRPRLVCETLTPAASPPAHE